MFILSPEQEPELGHHHIGDSHQSQNRTYNLFARQHQFFYPSAQSDPAQDRRQQDQHQRLPAHHPEQERTLL